jgi:DNA sulfur modification protein DndE
MPYMQLNRIRISEAATKRLQILKGRTGLTPNLLCRLALAYSLNDPQVPPQVKDGAGQEFNKYTLFGEWEVLYLALVKERCHADGIDPESELSTQLHAHLERGIVGVFSRVRHVSDIRNLAPGQGEALPNGN